MLRKYTTFLLYPLHYTNDTKEALKTQLNKLRSPGGPVEVLPSRHYGRLGSLLCSCCAVGRVVGRRHGHVWRGARARRGRHGRRAPGARLPAHARRAAAGRAASHHHAHHQLLIRPVSTFSTFL